VVRPASKIVHGSIDLMVSLPFCAQLSSEDDEPVSDQGVHEPRVLIPSCAPIAAAYRSEPGATCTVRSAALNRVNATE
jgi:hypothetical protein